MKNDYPEVADLCAGALELLPKLEEENRARLVEFIGIKSVSALPEHASDVEEAAAFLAAELRDIGFSNVDTIRTPGPSMVVGELRCSQPDAPTILVYGHFDVQPVEPLDEWRSDPWSVVVNSEERRMYARGIADDKGQIWMHLLALRALLAVSEGCLPYNIRFIAEGEEEVGSPNMAWFLREYPERVQADFAFVSDTPTYRADVPAIGYSLRGLCSLEVSVRTLERDLHSGQYGGAVPNAIETAASLIVSLHDAEGHVLVPGFYDDVMPVPEEELSDLGNLPFDREEWLSRAGASAVVGESGYSALELTWTRPTLEVNGVHGGHTGSGTKTIVPSRASFKLSARLVPGMDPSNIQALVSRYLRSLCPPYVDIQITLGEGLGEPYLLPPTGPVSEMAVKALSLGFGCDVDFVRDGGAIPFVPLLKREVGVDSLLLGFGSPDENKHAPNEWLSLNHYESGLRSLVFLYAELAASPAWRRSV